MLELVYDTIETVPENYRDLYTERDGKFHLTGVKGMKSQADIDRLQTALTKERNDHKATRDKLTTFGDMDPEQVQAQLDRIPELEAAAAAAAALLPARFAPMHRAGETRRVVAHGHLIEGLIAQRRQMPGDSSVVETALSQLRELLGAPGLGHASPAGPATRLSVIQAGVGNTVHLVPVAEVLYFEAADKYVRVVTAEREHLIRLSLRELLPQLDAQQFWQVHRSLVVRATAIAVAQRDESGKVYLTLRGRPERLTASRLYAHLFRGM